MIKIDTSQIGLLRCYVLLRRSHGSSVSSYAGNEEAQEPEFHAARSPGGGVRLSDSLTIRLSDPLLMHRYLEEISIDEGVEMIDEEGEGSAPVCTRTWVESGSDADREWEYEEDQPPISKSARVQFLISLDPSLGELHSWPSIAYVRAHLCLYCSACHRQRV